MSFDPNPSIDTRLQLHWAAQVVAAVGDSLVPARPDYSHAALTWDSARGLSCEVAPGDAPWRASIDLAAATLSLEVGGDVKSRLELNGKTLEAATDWLRTEAPTREAIARPPHLPPDHPAAEGQPFAIDTGAARALAAWYALAADVLDARRAEDPAAAPVRLWPHHFDLATLSTFDPDTDPEEARSIGVGFSPGDEGYPPPYFYVTPWPYPDPATLPELPDGGHWHTEGWVGAVLTAPDLVAAVGNDDAAIRDGLTEFLTTAVGACRRALAVD